MPRMSEMKIGDMSRLTPVNVGQASTPAPTPAPPTIATTNAITPSPFMMSSLPNIAASYDQFTRQFYGRVSFPQYRAFPIGISI